MAQIRGDRNNKGEHVALKVFWPVLAACYLLIANACGTTEPPPQPATARIGADSSGLGGFTQRVEEYAAYRRRLAGPFGAIDETKSPQDIAQRETAFANAIKEARAQAKAGDIFVADAVPVLKSIIRQTYRSSPEVRDTRKDAEIELPDFVPVVNTVYPTAFPLATFPPTLLEVLPELPEAFEYRIVTHHLILRDSEANLIIDVLPNAIP